MATFDKNDDSVVVVIGSGAGGGTLGTDLALKGIKTVILEAGGRHEIEDFINDEWGSFGHLAWVDPRTTTGSWQVSKDFSGLPAWIVKAVGGSTTPLGRRLFAVPGTRIQGKDNLWRSAGGQSARLACYPGRDGTLLRQGRGSHGCHPHQRHRRPAGQ